MGFMDPPSRESDSVVPLNQASVIGEWISSAAMMLEADVNRVQCVLDALSFVADEPTAPSWQQYPFWCHQDQLHMLPGSVPLLISDGDFELAWQLVDYLSLPDKLNDAFIRAGARNELQQKGFVSCLAPPHQMLVLSCVKQLCITIWEKLNYHSDSNMACE
jgi:hypothetical protein